MHNFLIFFFFLQEHGMENCENSVDCHQIDKKVETELDFGYNSWWKFNRAYTADGSGNGGPKKRICGTLLATFCWSLIFHGLRL